jgi:hypothetical protein
MIGGFIGRNISRTNRNLLLVNGIIVACCLVVLALVLPWLKTVFHGPKPMKVSDVAQIRDPDEIKDWYVTVDFEPHRFLAEYYQISGSKSGTRNYSFYQTNQGTLIVHTGKISDPPTQITGKIRGHTSEVTSKVLSNVPRTARRPVLPVMVQSDNPMIGVWVFGAVWTPFFAFGVWNLTKAAKRLSDQSKHPIMSKLGRLGSPEQLAPAIDAEMAANHQVTGNVHLTRSWLCRPTTYGLDLVHLPDVLWAYRKQTKHYTNGVPTGTTHATVVRDRHGQSVELQMRKTEQVDELLSAIGGAVPEALIGFDEQLDRIWLKNKQEVIAAVDQRRRQRMSGAVAGPHGSSAPPSPPPPVARN